MNKLLQQEHGQVGLDQFQLFRRLGSGIIGNVYVCSFPIIAFTALRHENGW